MGGTPANNPPTPVLEQLSPALGQDVDCEALKVKFGLETGSHKANTSGKSKKSSRAYQSHHVFQDAATDAIIERGLAIWPSRSCWSTATPEPSTAR